MGILSNFSGSWKARGIPGYRELVGQDPGEIRENDRFADAVRNIADVLDGTVPSVLCSGEDGLARLQILNNGDIVKLYRFMESGRYSGTVKRSCRIMKILRRMIALQMLSAISQTFLMALLPRCYVPERTDLRGYNDSRCACRSKPTKVRGTCSSGEIPRVDLWYFTRRFYLSGMSYPRIHKKNIMSGPFLG